jgi:hypothetical protein
MKNELTPAQTRRYDFLRSLGHTHERAIQAAANMIGAATDKARHEMLAAAFI